jgi:hypothetical protein
MIRLRAADGDVTGPVKTGRGKAQFDEIRRQLESFGRRGPHAARAQ